MPIGIEWDNEAKTILRFEFDGVWTWEDFQPVYLEGNHMIASVDHPVDVILDVQKSGGRPRDLMLNIKRLKATNPPNHGRQVIVRKGQFSKVMIATYNRLFGKKPNPDLLHANTLEEARSILAHETLSTTT